MKAFSEKFRSFMAFFIWPFIFKIFFADYGLFIKINQLKQDF